MIFDMWPALYILNSNPLDQHFTKESKWRGADGSIVLILNSVEANTHQSREETLSL